MDIVLTGTGSSLPGANQAVPSTLVKTGDTVVAAVVAAVILCRLPGNSRA